MSFTPLSELGEFVLIDTLTQDFKIQNPSVIKGVGDDAAVIRVGNEQVQVISTDLLAEGVHFDLSYVPLRHLGYKAVVVNLSDILAMNAMAYGVTVSIAVSSRFTVEALQEFYAGVKLACEAYHVDLLGGDTSSSRQGMIISVSAFGLAQEAEVVYRSGAQVNDLLCVTGDLGAAYAGFLVLDREKASFIDSPETQPDLTDYDYVIGRQLKPEIQGPVLQKLAEKGIKPHAMMDISDGLASELHHICRASKVGCQVYANKLPIDFQTVNVAEEFEISPTTFAMNGGEDYELLMALPVSVYQDIAEIKELTIVGKVTNEEGQVEIFLDSGEVAAVEAQGWQHFSRKMEE
ncbi:MAG: thiamine-phosphate kinase [Bacteroidota bacterium]